MQLLRIRHLFAVEGQISRSLWARSAARSVPSSTAFLDLSSKLRASSSSRAEFSSCLSCSSSSSTASMDLWIVSSCCCSSPALDTSHYQGLDSGMSVSHLAKFRSAAARSIFSFNCRACACSASMHKKLAARSRLPLLSRCS